MITRAEHFRSGPVLDQNIQPNRFYFIFSFGTEPNRNRFKPINFGSVRFGFFPFQTGSNPMVLSTSPAASYSRSQVTGGEDPFGLLRLDPCLQPHLRPTAHSVDWGDPDKTQPCKSGKKPKTRTLTPKNIITKTSKLSYFKKKHKGSNTLVFLVQQGRSFLLKSSLRVEWAIWRVNPAK